jgi:hypothetical protein
LCLLLGGLAFVVGCGLLMLYWLGPSMGMQPVKSVMLAGVVASVLGAGIFLVAKGGRTWPAWTVLIALVTATFASGRTVEQWGPHVASWWAGRNGAHQDETTPVVPVANALQKDSGNSGNAAAGKTDASSAKSAKSSDFAEGTEITAEQFVSDHIEPALKAISAYEGYTCTFHKREWAKPLLGDYRLTNEVISLKVRHEPFSAYLHFDNAEKRGTEALYVEGKNGGNVIAHSTKFPQNLVGTIRVPPTDSKVMADNRYPITNIGMKNLMLKFKNDGEKYKDDLKEVSFTIVKDEQIDKRPCKVIEIWNPKPEKYPRASARLYIDREWGVPVGFESYEKTSGRSTLVEYYRYTNLKFNPGLKDRDFDPANYAYP